MVSLAILVGWPFEHIASMTTKHMSKYSRIMVSPTWVGQTVLESRNVKVQLFWLNPSTRQGQTDVGATKPEKNSQIIVR